MRAALAGAWHEVTMHLPCFTPAWSRAKGLVRVCSTAVMNRAGGQYHHESQTQELVLRSLTNA